jgi:hypothetical protein
MCYEAVTTLPPLSCQRVTPSVTTYESLSPTANLATTPISAPESDRLYISNPCIRYRTAIDQDAYVVCWSTIAHDGLATTYSASLRTELTMAALRLTSGQSRLDDLEPDIFTNDKQEVCSQFVWSRHLARRRATSLTIL